MIIPTDDREELKRRVENEAVFTVEIMLAALKPCLESVLEK